MKSAEGLPCPTCSSPWNQVTETRQSADGKKAPQMQERPSFPATAAEPATEAAGE